MLIVHIIAAVLGVLGSYTWALTHFIDHAPSRAENMGKWMTLLGIFLVVPTGIVLFARDPETFLASGKFLSNMIILLLLIAIESSYVWIRSATAWSYSRVLSVFSWTWILCAALLNPSYPAIYFLVAYAFCASMLMACVKLTRDS